MSESPHLGLGYLAPSQAQKHVTVNEAFRRLDAIVQLGVIDRDRAAPPSSPEEGDRHIVAAAATGDWAGRTGRIAAFLDGQWVFIEPKPGWLAFVAAESAMVAFVSGAWSATLEHVTKLGVNATADAVNRLAVASEAALFNNVGAGVQVKLNKASAGDVASFLFQHGFSGRAEFGLVGTDGFSLKVSPDGAAWTTALSVDPATGSVELPATARLRVDKFTAGGTWIKPDWASRVVVELISGGNGGGSGALRGVGVAASGGSGAGPATYTCQEFLAADLPASVSVTVGAGGSGGAAQATTDQNGSPGSLGGTSSFGAFARALASGVGAAGTNASVAGGTTLGDRFLPPCQNVVGGSGAVGLGAAGGAGPGKYAAAGGGGGGVSTANAGGLGGASGLNRQGTPSARTCAGGAADGAAGVAGAAHPLLYFAHGDSGGGGAAGVTTNGGAGGAGAAPGGSGGGGGGARNGFSSGKGGDGARGEVWVTSYR